MLVNFFNDEVLTREFEISFTYRQSAAYDAGFRSRVTRAFDVRPLPLKDVAQFNAATARLPATLGRLLRFAARVVLLRYWYLAWNTLLLYRAIGKPALLHINNGNYPGAYSCMAAVFAARLRGVRRIIFVVNNIAIPYDTVRRWLDYSFDRLVATWVTTFVTASRHAGQALQAVLRLPQGKIANIHNGITPRAITANRADTLRRLRVNDARTLIGVVAILEERKGHLVLLEAVTHLKKHIRPAALPLIIIEGTGSQSGTIKEFVAAHGLDNDVIMIGGEPKIFDFMNAMDAIVLPSISHEDFPNVVIEAMSLGKPVIASRLAGIPEQIEHMESGLLVEPGDSAGLAEAIEMLCENSALRERLGHNARSRFGECFTATTAIAGYRSLYQQLLISENLINE
jgi:glycosyltransferase involved in cell wall biosynthesis